METIIDKDGNRIDVTNMDGMKQNQTWTQEQWEKERDLAFAMLAVPSPSLFDHIRERLTFIAKTTRSAEELAAILKVAAMLDDKEPQMVKELIQVYCPCGSTRFEGGKCKHCLRPKFWKSGKDFVENNQ